MHGLGFTLRYALRVLARDRAFSLSVVFVLGIGIAANTVGFSILNTVLLKDLPYKDADELVSVWISAPASGDDQITPSLSDFRVWQDLQEKGRVFEELAAYVNPGHVLEEGGYPENVSSVKTSTHIHSMLGIKPVAGRIFMPEEGHAGRNQVAMISSSLWERKFKSAKSIIGQPITLDGVRHTLVGVFPDRSGLDRNNSTDVWTPLATEEYVGPIFVLARLKPGLNVDRAREELLASSGQLGQGISRSLGKLEVNIIPLHEWWYGVDASDIVSRIWRSSTGAVDRIRQRGKSVSSEAARPDGRRRNSSGSRWQSWIHPGTLSCRVSVAHRLRNCSWNSSGLLDLGSHQDLPSGDNSSIGRDRN